MFKFGGCGRLPSITCLANKEYRCGRIRYTFTSIIGSHKVRFSTGGWRNHWKDSGFKSNQLRTLLYSYWSKRNTCGGSLETRFGFFRWKVKLQNTWNCTTNLHQPTEKLVTLSKNANVWSDSYNSDIANIKLWCRLWRVYAQTPPQPMVSLPWASTFNQKLSSGYY